MHSILNRQIKTFFGSNVPKSEEFSKFLNSIDEAYKNFDEGRLLTERSLDLSSKELSERNKVLEENEAHFRQLAENIPDLIMRFDRDFKYVYVNNQIEKITGIKVEQLLGKAIEEMEFLKPLIEQLDLKFKEALNGKKESSMDFSLEGKSGTQYFESRIVPELDSRGEVGTLLWINHEITKRKKDEEENNELINRIKLLLESTDEGIFGQDIKGNCVLINKSGARMLGYNIEEVIGKSMHSLIHYKHSDGTPYVVGDCPILHTLNTGKSIRIDNEVLWGKDGTAISVQYSSNPIIDNGVIKGVVVTFTEITEKIIIEREREKNLALFKSLVDNLQSGVFVESNQGIIFAVNKKFMQLFNLDPREGSRFTEVNYQVFKNPQVVRQKTDDITKKKELSLGHEILIKDGRIFEMDYIPINSSEGTFIGHMWMYTDITERKQQHEILEAKNTELERFNKFAVGRELKMIELKKRIKDLEEKMPPK